MERARPQPSHCLGFHSGSGAPLGMGSSSALVNFYPLLSCCLSAPLPSPGDGAVFKLQVPSLQRKGCSTTPERAQWPGAYLLGDLESL